MYATGIIAILNAFKCVNNKSYWFIVCQKQHPNYKKKKVPSTRGSHAFIISKIISFWHY